MRKESFQKMFGDLKIKTKRCDINTCSSTDLRDNFYRVKKSGTLKRGGQLFPYENLISLSRRESVVRQYSQKSHFHLKQTL